MDKRIKYKVLAENIGRKISDIPSSNIFTLSYMYPRARNTKGKINKWDFIKIKSFCMAKENISNMKMNQLYEKLYLPIIPQTMV